MRTRHDKSHQTIISSTRCHLHQPATIHQQWQQNDNFREKPTNTAPTKAYPTPTADGHLPDDITHATLLERHHHCHHTINTPSSLTTPATT